MCCLDIAVSVGDVLNTVEEVLVWIDEGEIKVPVCFERRILEANVWGFVASSVAESSAEESYTLALLFWITLQSCCLFDS